MSEDKQKLINDSVEKALAGDADAINNIEDRDQKDSNRKTSPLIIDNDAILIDNTNKTISEQLQLVKEIVQSRFYN